MTTGVLDEDMMIKALSTKATVPSAAQMQAGAFMLIMDAYDRKADRAHFLTAVAGALQLWDTLGRVCAFASVIQFLQTHKNVTMPDLLIAQQMVTDSANAHAVECLKMAHLLKQCAPDEAVVQ